MESKKTFIVYEIRNKINSRYYRGKTSHDRWHGIGAPIYWGSGEALPIAYEKYGKENFERIAISEHESEDEAYYNEWLVTEDWNTPECYNQRRGGIGGWEHYNGSEKHLESARKGGQVSADILKKNGNPFAFKSGDKFTQKMQKIACKASARDRVDNPDKYKKIYESVGKKNSVWTKVNNPMSIRCWCLPSDFVNPNKDRKVFLKNDIPDGWLPIKEARRIRRQEDKISGKNATLEVNRA